MKTITKVALELLRFVIFMPFIPFVIVLMVYFGWIIGIARRMPEDLEEQVRCANAQNVTKWNEE